MTTLSFFSATGGELTLVSQACHGYALVVSTSPSWAAPRSRSPTRN
ncbi:CobN component of cobalt chelatase [Cutibacterium acnes JCM 18909]|nr:CobN component of cobalt chelatase [Cutibacterium acnes JCM 18909]